jgi:hypothetical protein
LLLSATVLDRRRRDNLAPIDAGQALSIERTALASPTPSAAIAVERIRVCAHADLDESVDHRQCGALVGCSRHVS